MFVSFQEALSKVKVDKATGIGIAEIAKGNESSVHLAVIEPGKKLKAHFHKNRDEVYIILSGKGVMRLNNSFFEVKAKDVIFIPKKTVHSIKSKDDEKLIFIFISAPPFDPEKDRFFVE